MADFQDPLCGVRSGTACWGVRSALSLPGLVSLRRAVGSATGPLIRPGRDLLLSAAVLVPASPAQFSLCRGQNILAVRAARLRPRPMPGAVT